MGFQTNFKPAGPWRSEEYKAFIRTKPCMVCGRGPTIPHHEPLGKGGKGTKAPDSHCLPLCQSCHDLVHHGRKTFWGSFNVEMAIIELCTEFMARKGKE